MSWNNLEEMNALVKHLSLMSKGQKKQAMIILAYALKANYLFFDESFDGLDPVMRLNFKKLLISEMAERELTVIISSHDIRELEDFCDELIMFKDGKLIKQTSSEEFTSAIHKLQFITKNPITTELDSFNIIEKEVSGMVYRIVTKDDVEAIRTALSPLDLILFEEIPMRLDEAFVSELVERGYESYDA